MVRPERPFFHELRRSFSKRLFCESLQDLVPEIQIGDLETGGAGVRAQAIERDGSPVQDFRFAEEPGMVHLLNAPVPARPRLWQLATK